MDGQHSIRGPAGFYTFKLNFMWFPELLIRLDILHNYLVAGEDNKSVFSISGHTPTA
jgi:hypothetical protein